MVVVRDIGGYGKGSLRLLGRSLREDILGSLRFTFRNTIAGSVLIPRALRMILYRLSGLDIRSPNVFAGQIIDNSYLRIGQRTLVNRACYFEGSGTIAIGSDVMIGPEVAIITSNHDRLPTGEVNRVPVAQDVRIGDRVWIGARCLILPGSIVEDDCVIAAGGVVRGVCRAGMTYGGVPARPLSTSAKHPGRREKLAPQGPPPGAPARLADRSPG